MYYFTIYYLQLETANRNSIVDNNVLKLVVNK